MHLHPALSQSSKFCASSQSCSKFASSTASQLRNDHEAEFMCSVFKRFVDCSCPCSSCPFSFCVAIIQCNLLFSSLCVPHCLSQTFFSCKTFLLLFLRFCYCSIGKLAVLPLPFCCCLRFDVCWQCGTLLLFVFLCCHRGSSQLVGLIRCSAVKGLERACCPDSSKFLGINVCQ